VRITLTIGLTFLAIYCYAQDSDLTKELIKSRWKGNSNLESLGVSDTLRLLKDKKSGNFRFYKYGLLTQGKILKIDDYGQEKRMNKGFYFINKEDGLIFIKLRMGLRMTVGELIRINENELGLIIRTNTYLD